MRKENEQLAGCIEYLEKKVKYVLKHLKNDILAYCGITSIQSSFIGPLDNFDEADRLKALNDVADLAIDDAKALSIGIVADDSNR